MRTTVLQITAVLCVLAFALCMDPAERAERDRDAQLQAEEDAQYEAPSYEVVPHHTTYLNQVPQCDNYDPGFHGGQHYFYYQTNNARMPRCMAWILCAQFVLEDGTWVLRGPIAGMAYPNRLMRSANRNTFFSFRPILPRPRGYTRWLGDAMWVNTDMWFTNNPNAIVDARGGEHVVPEEPRGYHLITLALGGNAVDVQVMEDYHYTPSREEREQFALETQGRVEAFETQFAYMRENPVFAAFRDAIRQNQFDLLERARQQRRTPDLTQRYNAIVRGRDAPILQDFQNPASFRADHPLPIFRPMYEAMQPLHMIRFDFNHEVRAELVNRWTDNMNNINLIHNNPAYTERLAQLMDSYGMGETQFDPFFNTLKAWRAEVCGSATGQAAAFSSTQHTMSVSPSPAMGPSPSVTVTGGAAASTPARAAGPGRAVRQADTAGAAATRSRLPASTGECIMSGQVGSDNEEVADSEQEDHPSSGIPAPRAHPTRRAPARGDNALVRQHARSVDPESQDALTETLLKRQRK